MPWLVVLLAAAFGQEAVMENWEEAYKRAKSWGDEQTRQLRKHLPLRMARECAPARGNGTGMLVRCAVARALDRRSTYDQERQEAESQRAFDHLQQLQAEGAHVAKQVRVQLEPGDSAMTERWHHDLSLVHQQAGGYPRIFMLDLWGAECADHELGYRYSLELWVKTFLTEGNLALVEHVSAADFVYLPLCVRKQLFERTGLVESNPRPVKYLPYEGGLAEAAVLAVDEEYMMGHVQRLQRESPDFAQCVSRQSCRFLTTAIDGRHVYKKFAEFFGDKIVFITHMGMSGWAGQQPGDLYWTDLNGLSMRGEGDAWWTSEGGSKDPRPAGCRAACALHCRLEPPAVRPQDIVVPWGIGHMWTARSEDTQHRDLLGFFSGSLNSCARTLLMDTFRRDFILAAQVMGRPPPRQADLRRSYLVFPTIITLQQEEWSELAFRSHICLVVDGDSASTGRLIEVIMHGCVPVVVSNRLLPPFHEYIDWRMISYFVREDEIPALPGILQMIARDPSVLEEKRRRLREVANYLDYTQGLPAALLVALRSRVETTRVPTEDGWGIS